MPIASLANLQWNGPASGAAIGQVLTDFQFDASGLASANAIATISVVTSSAATRLVDRPATTQIVVSADGGAPKGRARIAVTADVAATPTAYDIAQAVHAQNLAGFNTTGTAGKYLKDAGGAGNPWNADLASNNSPGTFGEFVQKLLTVAKFLGLK